ncbi:LysM peptidoglycan-binding domain-containing protein [Enterocloster bolteae]|uniref:LysM peptidoglycan-binding domain-containing protein n=1 Tax=Enterocloster bolteae TaxID=208479 RepID=UPI001A99072F|nr:hypothetical protein [Enterocloster bolteae]MCG4898697.1 hypothetical protein [Enterocloster bolteae]
MTAKRKCGWTEKYLSRSTRELGEPLKCELIYQLNSGSVKNPDLIYEGKTLDIPKA